MKIRRTGAAEYGRYVKALICGSPGAGKTLVSSTFPDVLYAAAEGGLMSVADRDVAYVPIESSRDLLSLKKSLDQTPEVIESTFGFPIRTIVVDTIDEVQKIFVRERLAESRQETLKMQDWGWLGEVMSSVMAGFRNLNMNVIFTCHTKEVSDEESGRLYFRPNLQGQAAEAVTACFDLNLLIKTATKTETVDNKAIKVVTRYFQTVPDNNHSWIKDHSGKLPAEFPVNFEDDYQRMYDLIYGSMPVLAETQERVIEDVEPEPLAVPAEPQPKVSASTLVGTKPEKKPEPIPDPPAPATNGDASYECVECGEKEITEDQYNLSRIKYRKVMCRECFLKAKREKVGVK